MMVVMRRRDFQFFWVWMFLFVAGQGCGATQPVKEVSPPKPVLPKAGVCAGAQAGENVQVTLSIGESNFPSIVWEGDHFRIAWWDMRTQVAAIYHIGMDKSGFEVSPPTKIPNQGPSMNQSLAFDGRETHIVWNEDKRVMSARFSETPSPVKVLANKGTQPAAGPWGSAVWVDRGRLFFQCDGMVTPEGVPMDPVVIAAGGVEHPRIAYNGVFFAVVWSASAPGGREIRLQRVSPKGKRLGEPVKVSALEGIAREPAITWDGDRFIVGWTTAGKAPGTPRDRYRVSVAIVPQVGNRPVWASDLDRWASEEAVDVAATGEEVAVAWVGSKGEGGASTVLFQRLDMDGAPKGGAVDIMDGAPLICSRPNLAWDGSSYAVVWHDDRGGVDSEVYFTYLTCGDAKTPESENGGASATPEGDPKQADPAPALKEIF